MVRCVAHIIALLQHRPLFNPFLHFIIQHPMYYLSPPLLTYDGTLGNFPNSSGTFSSCGPGFSFPSPLPFPFALPPFPFSSLFSSTCFSSPDAPPSPLDSFAPDFGDNSSTILFGSFHASATYLVWEPRAKTWSDALRNWIDVKARVFPTWVD